MSHDYPSDTDRVVSELDYIGRQLAASLPTLRDRFAMAALQSMGVGKDPRVFPAVAERAYQMADAMIKAKEGGQ